MPKCNVVPLVKGFLPVRLKVPPLAKYNKLSVDDDETFFYVKEHTTKHDDTTKTGKSRTLFVCNAPIVPGVNGKLLLQSLFGRFGDVERVTVVAGPTNAAARRTKQQPESAKNDYEFQQLTSWTSAFHAPSCLPVVPEAGKFAHVVFTSHGEMHKAWRALTKSMAPVFDNNSNSDYGLELDEMERQALADASSAVPSIPDSHAASTDDDRRPLTGIHVLASRYRDSVRQLDRAALLEECNRAMQAYEDAEAAAKSAASAASMRPDDDGFVTVSYGTTASLLSSSSHHPGAVPDDDAHTDKTTTATISSASRRRKGAQQRARSAKPKTRGGGHAALPDFYRFQTKQSRKRHLDELRTHFEQDLAKVKSLKQQK